MKTKFKYVILATTALTMGLSSCSKNEDQPQPEGKPTAMSLVISQPKSYADNDPTTAETKINTIDVYIHNESGVFIKREHFDENNITVNENGTLTPKNSIVTTTGKKNIYVGINLSSELAKAIENTDPGKEAQTVASAAALSSAGFAMFCYGAKDLDMKVGEKNAVEISVARLLAKVVVRKVTNLQTNTDPISITGGTIQDLQFNVDNFNTKFFPSRPEKAFTDPNWDHTIKENKGDFVKADDKNYKNVNAYGIASNADDCNSFYTTENTSDGAVANQHTYVIVRGVYMPENMVTYTNTTLGKGDAIKKGDTFYKVTVDGKNYFFADSGQANNFAEAKNGTGAKATEYKSGYVYYNAFLNPEPTVGEKKYDVLRNTIYNVNITKINGLGAATPGVDDNTDEPIVDNVNMTVVVTVEAWKTSFQDSELTGKN